MRAIIALGTAAACALLATAAVAQAPTPEEQAKQSVEVRQGLFKVIGFNNGPMGAMMRGRAPYDAAVAKKNAAYIATLGEMIPAVFANDTSSFDSIETTALDSIWTNKAAFDEKAAALVTAAKALAAVPDGAGEAVLKPAIMAMGKTCGSCHDDFRPKEN